MVVITFGSEEMTTTYFVGLDVSIESTAVCVIDETRRVEEELSVPSHPADLAAALEPFSEAIGTVGLEAGPISESVAHRNHQGV